MQEITKRKISQALRGRKKTATHKERISQALRGSRKTDTHKRAISEALREYHRQNLIQYNTMQI